MSSEALPPPQPKVSPDKSGNSTALDQWRGFALLLVLISHGFYFTDRVNGIGRIGVNLFFFISGILVYRSLNSSSRKGDMERAVSFWRRRFIRLFPAMMVYLIVMIPVVFFLQTSPGQPPGSDFGIFLKELPYALFFWVDYGPYLPRSVGHLWSVSVEMQFYALAPIILFLGGKSDPQRLIVWTGILLLLMVLGVLELLGGYQEKYQFHVTVWPLMLGFLMEYKKGWAAWVPQSWALCAIRVGWVLIFLTMILMVFNLNKGLVIALGSPIFIPCFLSYVTGRALPGARGRILAWMGERTYSIYLWQQPLTICDFVPAAFQPMGAALSTAVGAVSYHYFERPFLSAKRRPAS